ncbi:MAG: IscS subfamily cysteine desulfurase [Acidobacteriota bacterium]|nr:MAG: IscS subfamily cysteine desulfurase [Acidobacteriota bacterium]
MRHVYLDNNATTPLDPAAFEAMKPYLLEHFGNASSVHQQGQRAKSAIELARQQVANLIGCDASAIVFNSGGTESDNSAVRGVAYARREEGRHIVTSRIEHPAVLRTCESLESEGFRVTYLGVNEEGVISVDELENALTDETTLISIMYANNETGAIQPLCDVCRLAKERGITVHSDAVQAVAKIPVDLEQLPLDLVSLTGHKFHGPKGVGALYVRKGSPFHPMMLGGSHERNRRGGTENVPGIVGLGAACELAQWGLERFGTETTALRDRLESSLLDRIPGLEVNGPKERRVPHVANLSFEDVPGEALLIALDFRGIAVSTGAACTSGSVSPSHVLMAMGLGDKRIGGAIRFSLSRFTTAEDIDYVLSILPDAVEKIRQIGPGSH